MGLKSRQPDRNVCSLQPQQSSPSTRPLNKRNNGAKHSQEHESVVEADLSAEFWRTARQKADHKRHNRQTNSTSKPMPKRPNHSGGVTRQQRFTDCCDYCGEPNHRMNNCRHGRHIECNECHRFGHKSKFCSYYWDAGQEEWPTSTLRPNHDINYSDLDSCDSSNCQRGWSVCLYKELSWCQTQRWFNVRWNWCRMGWNYYWKSQLLDMHCVSPQSTHTVYYEKILDMLDKVDA